MEFGVIFLKKNTFYIFNVFCPLKQTSFQFLFCLVVFFLDENEMAVLTRENELYYGSLGILTNFLIKVGKVKVRGIIGLVGDKSCPPTCRLFLKARNCPGC